MDDDFFVEEADSSEEVGVWVEVWGNRRKVARKGRFGNGAASAGRFDVEQVIRQGAVHAGF